MNEAIIVAGRKENFVPAECFVALEMNYCLDTTRLRVDSIVAKQTKLKSRWQFILTRRLANRVVLI